MIETVTKKYKALNEIAEQNGILIFGGTEDREIPLCEIKQAFALNSNLYNRSVANLSVTDASEVYAACASELNPKTVMLHIGITDIKLFEENIQQFEQKYRELIEKIREKNNKCHIAIVSFKNPDETSGITALNKQLEYIAQSEQCEYCDISAKRIWNPKQTKDVVSFVYSMGFVQPLKNKRPIYDLAKMLFCCEA